MYIHITFYKILVRFDLNPVHDIYHNIKKDWKDVLQTEIDIHQHLIL
jgi:hypothetical protein